MIMPLGHRVFALALAPPVLVAARSSWWQSRRPDRSGCFSLAVCALGNTRSGRHQMTRPRVGSPPRGMRPHTHCVTALRRPQRLRAEPKRSRARTRVATAAQKHGEFHCLRGLCGRSRSTVALNTGRRAPSTALQGYQRSTCTRQIDDDRAGVELGVFSGDRRPASIVIDRGATELHTGGRIERRPR
jgi:hypothetical protein